MSWLELPPAVWFGVGLRRGGAASVIAGHPATRGTHDAGAPSRRPANVALLAVSLVARPRHGARRLWSPYYKITVGQDGPDTVVEVNNIFHQSMAPVEQKEYFYQWPYSVFGDTFENVLILGAGSGTDVAAALRHGAKHVDAVEIDPAILRLGRAASSRSSVLRSAGHRHQRRRAAFPADDRRRSTTWSCSR